MGDRARMNVVVIGVGFGLVVSGKTRAMKIPDQTPIVG